MSLLVALSDEHRSDNKLRHERKQAIFGRTCELRRTKEVVNQQECQIASVHRFGKVDPSLKPRLVLRLFDPAVASSANSFGRSSPYRFNRGTGIALRASILAQPTPDVRSSFGIHHSWISPSSHGGTNLSFRVDMLLELDNGPGTRGDPNSSRSKRSTFTIQVSNMAMDDGLPLNRCCFLWFAGRCPPVLMDFPSLSDPLIRLALSSVRPLLELCYQRFSSTP